VQVLGLVNYPVNNYRENYLVIKKEALGMIYVVQKYRHFLLGSIVIFHVEHDALKYMINKPQLSRKIARWM
jgi:hypothetical protein